MPKVEKKGPPLHDPPDWMPGETLYPMFGLIAYGAEPVIKWLAEKWDKWRHLNTSPRNICVRIADKNTSPVYRAETAYKGILKIKRSACLDEVVAWADAQNKEHAQHWLNARKLFIEDCIELKLRIYTQARYGKERKNKGSSAKRWHLDRSTLLVPSAKLPPPRVHVLEAGTRCPKTGE